MALSPIRMARLVLLLLALQAFMACKPQKPASIEVFSEEHLPKDTLNVAFLVMDGVFNTEFTAAYDIFHHTVFREGVHPMKVFSISKDSQLVTTFEGIKVLTDYNISGPHPRIDVLAVPSAEHHLDSDLEDEKLINWVRKTGKDAQFVISFCDGAFVLAEAGLLEGLRCTTFPADINAFKKRYPQLPVQRDVLWVHDGKAITSAGGARSFEPALYLCEYLYGKKVAQEIAEGMVIEWDKMDHSFLSPFGDHNTRKD